MPRFCSRERILILKRGGLKYTIIGLQGSERMNRELYGRKETNDSFVNACNLMAEMGVNYSIDVILDSPYETEDDLRDVARTLNRLRRPFKVRAFSMTPFPETALYGQAAADGLLEMFASDPYESAAVVYTSLIVAARPDAYRTPAYWHKLIHSIIPLYSGKTIDQLIEESPRNSAAAAAVDRLYAKATRNLILAERLRATAPRLFQTALDLYVWLKRRRAG